MARRQTLDLLTQGADGELEQVTFTVTPGEHAGRALLADTIPKRTSGMLAVADLGEVDGMLFRYSHPVRVGFHMVGMDEPLELAWFDQAGWLIDSTTMQPGLVGYTAPRPFVAALETPVGGLERLGIVPGSRITF